MVDRKEETFSEIPEAIKKRISEKIQLEIFELLHAEAVANGDIPTAPKSKFNGPIGRVGQLLMQIGLGGAMGTFAVAACMYMIRKLTTVI
jgi:hypothetical protein